MTLVEYRRKRDFRKTPEPVGKKKPRGGRFLYVVQKHAASHLHYDFWLQIGDVLKSWAVPKGPSLDPHDKRLAIEVEDHPIAYGSFEGIIPEGEYGGGTVLLWDRGRWNPLEDPEAGYAAGKLKFELEGEKLRGGWALVRRSGGGSSSKQPWFLIKHRDDEARDKDEFDVTADAPRSVVSGRDLDEIAADRDRVWREDGDHAPRQSAAETSALKQVASNRAPRRSAKATSHDERARGPIPATIVPELATLIKKPPSGDSWFHEIKFDGYRIICHVAKNRVRFQTRNEQDWTSKLPELAAAVRRLKLRQAIFDGEIVALDERGVSQFQLLQNAFRESPGKIIYHVFDLLFLNGDDLRRLPLAERKELLASLHLPTDRGPLRLTEHVVGDGEAFLAAARHAALEGIISKRRDRPYVSGRTADWLKSKTHQNAEFVIGGFTDPTGSRQEFGALLVGYHDERGRLKYSGRVGTGFADETLRDVARRLKPLRQEQSPFSDFPERGERIKGVHWVRPELVAQIEFSNWTKDQRLRHPSFQGLREDKPAAEVTREIAKSLSENRRGLSPFVAGTIASMVAEQKGTVPFSSGGSRIVSNSAASSSTNGDLPPARPRKAKSQVQSNGAGGQDVVVAGVHVTHPDKLLYPDDGITKRELAEYYLACAERILPHVVGRPLTIVRCPNGVDGTRFLQKHPGAGAPKALRRVRLREKEGMAEYCVVEDVGGLVALAQIAALEIHVWGSRIDAIEKPDRLVFDLDPAPDVAWPAVVAAAQELREFLNELKLESFVKTSGGKGLHLVVPIARRQPWPFVDRFSRLVALAVERAAPTRYLATMSKKARTGRIYIDYLRNQRGATAVAAYSTRAKSGAAISLPLSWRELPRTKSSTQFHLRDVLKRLATDRADPWPGFADLRQSIRSDAVRTLESHGFGLAPRPFSTQVARKL
ncbi:MAG TPA: DNA ligase D [Pirellulales bacterium]|jgi:bifunctional non-homologous end joining protein LigD|nr:DNA ligase D [Pirellulales bacterium]